MKANKELFILTLLLFLALNVYGQNSGPAGAIEHYGEGKNQNLSDAELMTLFNETILQSHEKSHKLGNLGKERIPGNIQGSFTYYCRLSGFNEVTIEMIYDDYCDTEGIVLDGFSTVIVDWSAKGIMIGEIAVKGDQSGRITYDLLINDGEEAGGNYYVSQDSAPQSTFPWDYLMPKKGRIVEVQSR